MNLTLHTPQILYLGLSLIGLGLVLAKHGDDIDGKHNFWVSLIRVALMCALLYWGGFFG